MRATPSRPTARTGSLLKGWAVIAVLAVAQDAVALNVLRRGGGGSAAPVDSAAAAAAAAAAQAAALVRQGESPLRRALDAIRGFQATQDAARAAAQGAASTVPNGLAPGGLQIADGADAPGSVLWQGASLPQLEVDGRTVTITQDEQKAILTWKSFNVGKETVLTFDQSLGGSAANTWIALNRVLDPSGQPSRILGSVKAEGQVYVINRNGILFDGSSQVNVSTLIASSMDVVGGDARFRAGILSGSGPTFGDGTAAGKITVAAGATLTSGPYGQLLLIGPEVENQGAMQAPDGQVLLAAGTVVTLAASRDPGLRGYASPVVSGGGTARNGGILSAPRGNVTLVGGAVDQDGLAFATTSGDANGSIRLGGDDRSAPVTFGGSSLTAVLPDADGKPVIGTTQFQASRLDAYGSRVTLEDGASVYVPSGKVTLSAPMSASVTGGPADGRVFVGDGARIDVSGLPDVVVEMAQNTVEAQLRADELRDNPVLRDTADVRGETVWFDGRLGVKVADLSGYYDLVERDVAQLMTRGGTVALEGSQILTRAGSVIDLSGGNLTYLDGYVRSSFLVDPTGRRVRIEDAKPGIAYVAVESGATVEHARWGLSEQFAAPFVRTGVRFENGYVEGSAAGTLILGAPAVPTTNGIPDPAPTDAFRVLDGAIVATTVVGPKQRQLPTGSTAPTIAWRERPAGATLVVNRAGDVLVADAPAQLAATFGAGSFLDPADAYQHLLPARWFDGQTFASVTVVSGYADDYSSNNVPTINYATGGHLVVAPGVVMDLGDGGSFAFAGKSATIGGTIRAPGGSVRVDARDKSEANTPPERPSITVEATGAIDVAGRWTNDLLDGVGSPVRAVDGGSIRLVARDVTLDPGSLLDVSGGGRLDYTGTKVTSGKGGSITIDVTQPLRPDPGMREAYDGRLTLGGAIAGWALGQGGSLTLNTDADLFIGDALPGGASASALLLSPSFFTQGGFASYSLVAERGVTILGGTELAPVTEALVLPEGAQAIATGTRLADVATRAVLPPELVRPMSLSLSTVPARSVQAGTVAYGDLEMEAGSRIELVPGSTVKLAAAHTLRVDGEISTKGGRIQLSAPDATLGTPVVQLGSGARLLTRGYVKTAPDGTLLRRSVERGGSITISAAASVRIDDGALLDVSGVLGVADLSSGGEAVVRGRRYAPTEVAGDAGAITITTGSEGGILAGVLALAPGGPAGAGGVLTVNSPSVPIVVSASAPAAPAAGQFTLSAARVNDSGLDELTLNVIAGIGAANSILFDGDVSLHARRALTLAAPMIGTVEPSVATSVSLDAGHVLLLGGETNSRSAILGGTPSSLLTINADSIDVANAVWLGCRTNGCSSGAFATTRLSALGDIRLSDRAAGGPGLAGLLSPGALVLEAAQVYVTSRAQDSNPLVRDDADPGFLVQSASSIEIVGNGGAAPVPLSFGERLTLRAPSITQGGVLRAPQGELVLEASTSLTLLSDSVTSASLGGATVPYGTVLAGGVFQGYRTAGQVPEKVVRLSGPSIQVAERAVIDVSGGGDLLGWQFNQGNGGSTDPLSAAGAFAVVPSVGASLAPLGGVSSLSDPSLKVGDSVWLGGVPGLPDGVYTLLPAHYALLPGGFLVRALAGSYGAAHSAQTLPDGSFLASGYRTSAGTPIRGAGWGRFLVAPESVFGAYGELRTWSFDQAAKQLAAEAGLVARTPNDAGTAVLSASQTLDLSGRGDFGAGPGGLLGNLDISAPKIAVVHDGGAAPGAGYLTLDVQALESFGAGSVLLGGTRRAGAAGTVVTVNATDVAVDTGAAGWTSPEILLAATQSVSVADGSTLRAGGAISLDTSALQLTGDGALLRLSTGGRAAVVRTGAAGAIGSLSIGTATLDGLGSIALDGSKAIGVAPTASLSAPQFDLASVRVNLGDVPEADRGTGTTFGPELLALLSTSSDVLIRGHDSIDLYGDLALGAATGAGPALRLVTLDTGLLQGHQDATGIARITAGTLVLQNSGAAGAAGTAGAGTLALDVDELRLGPGQVRLAGYGSLGGHAAELVAQGSGSMSFDGALALDTQLVRVASGTSYDVAVGGSLALTGGTGDEATASGHGARLSLQGATVLLDTTVVLPAGSITATATGGSLALGDHARLEVSGTATTFVDTVRFAPGGTIRLAASGDLAVAAGAVVDVSGSGAGGDAGLLSVSAGGVTTLGGALRGAAASGGAGGAFELDAGSIADPSGLIATLATGGFDASIGLRVRGGQDLTVGTAETLRAHEVRLRSDAGTVTVAGTVDAAGTAARPDGGTIELIGGAGVSVTGTLDASAASAAAGEPAPRDGKATLAALGGSVDVAPGATIDLGGGSLVVRAPRVGADVAVDQLAGTIAAGEIVVQGVKGYAASTVDATLASSLVGDASAWLLGADGIRARLAATGTSLPPLRVGAGMVVTSAGDLTVGSDVALNGLAGPGYLGLVAPGTIDVRARLSDGFASAGPGAALLSGRSATIELDAGRDVTLQPNAMIRTGTGDIAIRAGRDLRLLDPVLATDLAPVVYTAGQATATVPGFGGAPAGMPLGQFPTHGGDLTLRAGRDIVAPYLRQTTSAWLFRYGATNWLGDASSSTVKQQASWSIVFDNFRQGVGALGGGDVDVDAGRDVIQLQVAIPTTGQLATPVGEIPVAGDLTVRGGGDLDLRAGRDLLGGLFLLGRGEAELKIGGLVGPAAKSFNLRQEQAAASVFLADTVSTLFGLMDATARVTAGASVEIEGVYDPMVQGQVSANLAAGKGTAFAGYTERTAFEATSLGGAVTYSSNPWASVDVTSATNGGAAAFRVGMAGSNGLNDWFSRAPGTLRLTSLESSVHLRDNWRGSRKGMGRLLLAPSARGTLELLAAQDVGLLTSVELEDVAPGYRRGPLDPVAVTGDLLDGGVLLAPEVTNGRRGFTPIHEGDPAPVRIYALDGTVCGDYLGGCTPGTPVKLAQVVVPKRLQVYAGNDVFRGSYTAQNDGPASATWLLAGDDVYDAALQVRGEGIAAIAAGHDVSLHDLSDSAGASTSTWGGLLYGQADNGKSGDPNRALPRDRAASLAVMAGLGAGVAWDAFADAYLDPANAAGVAHVYLPELSTYMGGLGYGAMTDAERLAAFDALPFAQRQAFLLEIYFAELKQAGIEYNDATSERFHSYARGFDAVGRLFPTDPASLGPDGAGNILLDGKPLETWASGDITLVAPYGRIAIGNEFKDALGLGGVVTRRGGDIRVMADRNVDLFTSRVFTLQGGDITMWTSNGSITAGSGSKTSVFSVPLSYTTTSDGVVLVNAFGLQTGAGIGVLDALQGDDPGRTRSRLDLIAPHGEVNAGDAGIRVVGDINVAARVVVGVENIQVSGKAAGVPTVEAPSVAAATAGTQLAQSNVKQGAETEGPAKRAASNLPSLITVEVVGYENPGPDDEDPRRKTKRSK